MKLRQEPPDQRDVDLRQEQLRLASDELDEAVEVSSVRAHRVRREIPLRAEMAQGDAPKVLDLLAALSATTAFSIGCYCDDERRCHRGVLRDLLAQRGAAIEPDAG